MLRKFMVLSILAVAAYCFAGCKDDGGKSDEALCKDLCSKIYEECSSEAADAMDVDESDLDDYLDDCNDSCEPDDSYDDYYDCIDEAAADNNYPDECMSYDADYSPVVECQIDADCSDLIEYLTSTGSEDLCEDEIDDYNDAYDDAEGECEDALSDMDEDDYANFNEDAATCYEDYYPED